MRPAQLTCTIGIILCVILCLIFNVMQSFQMSSFGKINASAMTRNRDVINRTKDELRKREKIKQATGKKIALKETQHLDLEDNNSTQKKRRQENQ